MANTIPAYDVAAMFLRALGAPVTPAMQRAVAIWLRYESGGHITGNNPWNLHSGTACTGAYPGAVSSVTKAGTTVWYCPGNGSLPGQIGNRYAGPRDKNVAVFRTMQDGANASANNLIRLAPSYGYGKVISEARAGDAIGFLTALQNSSWSEGHYSHSKLVNAFRGAFNYNTTMTYGFPPGVGDTPAGPPAPTTKVLTIPFGTIIRKFQGVTGDTTTTATILRTWAIVIADTPDFVSQVTGGPNLTGASWDKFRTELEQNVTEYQGKPVSSLPDNVTIYLSPDATQPSSAQGPLETLASLAEGAGHIVGFLIDPQNWVYVIALIGGVVLTGYGFSQLTGARISRPSLPMPEVLPDDDATETTEEAA